MSLLCAYLVRVCAFEKIVNLSLNFLAIRTLETGTNPKNRRKKTPSCRCFQEVHINPFCVEIAFRMWRAVIYVRYF